MVGLNTLVGKRYKILAQIGKGGMSTVYLAMDSSLNKQWAIKEIRSASDPVQRDLVIKSLTVEANMIKRFDHPAIPRIVDLIEEKGSLFVVMDYVEGQTLASLLKKEGPQSEEDVVDWGIQLCDVLDYLHRRKHPVIFRDMKPSNVMLTPEGAQSSLSTSALHWRPARMRIASRWSVTTASSVRRASALPNSSPRTAPWTHVPISMRSVPPCSTC